MASAGTGIFSVGQTLGDGFGAMWRNFFAMSAIVLIFSIATSTLQFGLSYVTTGSFVADSAAGVAGGQNFTVSVIVSTIFGVCAYIVAQVALIRLALSDLQGRQRDIGGAIRDGFTHFFPAFGIQLLVVLALGAIYVGFLFFVGVISVAAASGGSAASMTVIVLLSFLAVVAVLMFFATGWAVPLVARLVEGTGVFRSLGRSWFLAKGNRWRIFVIYIVEFVILLALIIAMAAVMIPLFGSTASGGFTATWLFVLFPLQLAFSCLIWSLWACFMAALYVNLRRAKEGVTEDLVADIFE
ncbi:hypothetical protein [Parasphingopyxis marina]|uniref:DUF7847 domain-containing protein n=1 Tax=Parasphingopyxis marina TaxID=2761622 RepID=A0A842HV48_9SPHN|nr:hypothetical protein [Parasphingopyxis marina]MBC2776842.1 hypothetical protein [Parasphingopyxis marina]